MKYLCYKGNKYSDKAEFVRYSSSQFERGVVDASKNPEQKFILELCDIVISNDKLYAVQEENNNIIYDFIRLPDMIGYAKYCRGKEYIYDYMYHSPVSTWGLVSILRYHHASDIIITEPLTFDMNRIALLKNNMRVHIIPTLCRTPLQQEVEETGIRHFFVLPQHVHLYEDAIDVFEIIDGNTTRQQAIYEAYAIKGDYSVTPMNLLFTGLDLNMPGAVVPEEMMLKRLNCQQKCMADVGKSCSYCDRQLALWRAIKNRVSK